MPGDTFFHHIKNMHEYVDIPIIVVSGLPEQAYVIPKDIGPNLSFVKKTDVCGKLIEEMNGSGL